MGVAEVYLVVLVLSCGIPSGYGVTSDGYRVEHGSSPTIGNYVYAQNLRNSRIIRDCHDLREAEGFRTDGGYIINPTGLQPFLVYCKFEPGHAWTRIQHRVDASVSFQRGWHDYKWGFGHPTYNYWLGLEHLYQMTHKQKYRMRVTLEFWNDTRTYAVYDDFSVGTEQQLYRVRYNFAKGSAGDSLGQHHYFANFSTYDRDNDNRRYENCAVTHSGGWWYNSCDRANLNGHYYYMGELKNIKFDNGIEWTTAASHYSFQYASMMITPYLNHIQNRPSSVHNSDTTDKSRSRSGSGSTTGTDRPQTAQPTEGPSTPAETTPAPAAETEGPSAQDGQDGQDGQSLININLRVGSSQDGAAESPQTTTGAAATTTGGATTTAQEGATPPTTTRRRGLLRKLLNG